MSRDDGFDVADVATGLFDDPKVKALWRAIGDQGRVSHALALHMATLLASWRQGNRVTVQEAAPLWLDPDPELVAALKKARLLDSAGRIPARSWRGWFEPASERRDLLRGRWSRANARRKGVKSDSGTDSDTQKVIREPMSARATTVRGSGLADRLVRENSADTAPLPRGDHSVTATPVRPSVIPSVRPGAPAREGEAVQGTNGRGGQVPLAELVTPEALAAAGRKP